MNTNSETDKIIEKLKGISEEYEEEYYNCTFSTWSAEEKLQLLKLYHIFCKKEHKIFDLIYQNHGCDSWEDIFRDYDINKLDDKSTGVNIAIENLIDTIEYKNSRKTSCNPPSQDP